VITARGSDANVATRERVAGMCIRWAARRAAALIAVSTALRDVMVDRGLPADRITVVRNGVDLTTFQPRDREAARRALGLAGPTLLSVGNLVPEKGLDLVLEALQKLGDARLLVIGAGPEEDRLRRIADALDVTSRVSWVAPVPQEALAQYYSAADVTVLASTREGMPNVLLESLACGTPVVATAVGGSTEIVTASEAGALVYVRSGGALAAACRQLIVSPPDRAATRRYAERFGWPEPIAALVALFERVISQHRVETGSRASATR
jgi:teichuronic acid biosynthesis glycosyltransferase TuaC